MNKGDSLTAKLHLIVNNKYKQILQTNEDFRPYMS